MPAGHAGAVMPARHIIREIWRGERPDGNETPPVWTHSHPAGWLYLLLVVGSQALTVVLVYQRHPDLITERSGVARGSKAWDIPLAMGMAVIGPLAIAAVAGLDVRYDWIGYVSPRTVTAHSAAWAVGSLLTTWSMVTNPFFSGVVRIQNERGHTVVATGPYAFVRHPGYLGAILVTAATPYILGSRWAVFPAWAVVAVVIVRTWLEDRTLLAELGGYRDYAAQVRYRLVPLVW